jgi:signal transduction histidine kinase
MYMRLSNKQKECQEQLAKMEDWAEKAKSDEVSEDLLMSKAGYYQKFGMNDKSLQCYKQLVQRRSQGKDEQGVNQCYQDMLAQAKTGKNASLTRALERLYTNWQDSIKAVKAAQELKSLQDEYAASQNTLTEKESTISTQKGIITFLCILVAALAGGLLFFIGIMFKNMRQIKKQKKSLSIANDNNELKSKFINNIGEQIAPSLDAIEGGNVKKHVQALKDLMQHIQAYMELESTREERYDMKDMNISTLCENIMNKAKESFKPEVVASLNVPRVNVRTNAEALENILLYLLDNAARHTESGKITLEFKKRSAHSGQFIVTDTGTGIPEEKRATLFKPFAEVQDLTKGDGLGLPTCALMAYKLNGTLRLDEDYKKGTRFILELHS